MTLPQAIKASVARKSAFNRPPPLQRLTRVRAIEAGLVKDADAALDEIAPVARCGLGHQVAGLLVLVEKMQLAL
jgi:hypothetical protein